MILSRIQKNCMVLSKPPRDPKKAADAAQSPNATIEDLECLATSEFFLVREYVACHPNVNPTILDNLVPSDLDSPSELGSGKYSLALAIAGNAKSLPSTLDKLLSLIDLSQVDGLRRENKPYERLAVAILTHANCHRVVAVRLLNEWRLSRRVKLEAAKYSKSQDVLRILTSDRSMKVSDAALTRIDELKNLENDV
ncbi:MAG: hypothetical protein AB4290_31015 [Spirulina sp.]